jgi:hypothetical protein
VKFADRDLQETLDKPVPWRRVYGMALNSNLLDRGFLFGSIAVLLVWLFVPDSNGALANLAVIRSAPDRVYEVWLLGMVAVGMLFLAGEMDRRDRVIPILNQLKVGKVPIFILGLILFGAWVYVYRSSFASNISSAVSQPLQIVVIVILIPVIAFALVQMQTKGGKQPATI